MGIIIRFSPPAALAALRGEIVPRWALFCWETTPFHHRQNYMGASIVSSQSKVDQSEPVGAPLPFLSRENKVGTGPGPVPLPQKENRY